MKFKSLFTAAFLITGCLFFSACNNEQGSAEQHAQNTEPPTEQPETHGSEIKPEDVTLTAPLNPGVLAIA